MRVTQGIHGVAAGTIETLITASIIAGGLFVLMGSLLKRHQVISGLGSIAMSRFCHLSWSGSWY